RLSLCDDPVAVPGIHWRGFLGRLRSTAAGGGFEPEPVAYFLILIFGSIAAAGRHVGGKSLSGARHLLALSANEPEGCAMGDTTNVRSPAAPRLRADALLPVSAWPRREDPQPAHVGDFGKANA